MSLLGGGRTAVKPTLWGVQFSWPQRAVKWLIRTSRKRGSDEASIKRIRRAKKATGSATLRREGVGHTLWGSNGYPNRQRQGRRQRCPWSPVALGVARADEPCTGYSPLWGSGGPLIIIRGSLVVAASHPGVFRVPRESGIMADPCSQWPICPKSSLCNLHWQFLIQHSLLLFTAP